MKRRTKHSAADVEKALAQVARLAEPTPLERAEARMRKAKAEFTLATQALARGEKNALARFKAAEAEVWAAHRELNGDGPDIAVSRR